MRQSSTLNLLPSIVLIFVLAMAFVACQDEKKNYVPNIDNAREVPNMVTRDVETFISDSGITRYHITAKLWNIYDEAKVPRWTFPYGLFLEQYDDNFKQNAKVMCDSAIFFSDMKLWRLDGDVIMVNEKRDSFLTKELYWDQRTKRIYSDSSFVRIVSEERIIEGYGFSSNERMTDYSIKKPTAFFPARNLRNNPQAASGSATQSASDSTSQPVTPTESTPPPTPNNRGLKMSTVN